MKNNNSITYLEYNKLKSTYELDKMLRHDCMNIYVSLEDIHDDKVSQYLQNKFNVPKVSKNTLIETFTNATEFLIGKEEDIKVVRKGVVNTLKDIFEQLHDNIKLYIPQDVYPVYEMLAKEYHNNYNTFDTFNKDNYSELLNIKDSVLLFTLPSKPVENNIQLDEIRELVQSGNIVIIDTVYLREDEYELSKIAELDNIIILNSLSKSFLRPKTLGFVYDTTSLNIKYQEVDLDIQHYFNSLISRYNTCGILKHLIKYGWDKQVYKEGMDYESSHFLNNDYNYFKCIKGNYQDYVTNYNVLTIPVSVFNINKRYHDDYVLITPLLWLSGYLKDIKNK